MWSTVGTAGGWRNCPETVGWNLPKMTALRSTSPPPSSKEKGQGGGGGNRGLRDPDASSPRWCRKAQVIDLQAEGYWEELLDTTQPAIVVKDW